MIGVDQLVDSIGPLMPWIINTFYLVLGDGEYLSYDCNCNGRDHYKYSILEYVARVHDNCTLVVVNFNALNGCGKLFIIDALLLILNDVPVIHISTNDLNLF